MDKKKKDCFGILDNVFPMGDEGLREIVPACFDCPDKKACLQAALHTQQGLELKGELLEREPARGVVGRIRRWSERKTLSRRMKETRGKQR